MVRVCMYALLYHIKRVFTDLAGIYLKNNPVYLILDNIAHAYVGNMKKNH